MVSFLLIIIYTLGMLALVLGIYMKTKTDKSENKDINVSLVSSATSNFSSNSSSNSQNSSQPVSSNLPSKSVSSVEIEFNPDEYEKYTKELENIVKTKDPSVALNKLNLDIYTNKTAQESCHSLTHAIGHYALEKYNGDTAKAISFNVEICGGGYVHGIIEEFLHKTPNPESQILGLCQKDDGTCLHALGHGTMLLSKNDIDKSVNLCRLLRDNQQELLCGEGLFMENFDSENAPDSKKLFLKPTDPFYPCSNYTFPYSDACFYYSGRYLFKLNPDPYVALQKCYEAKNFAATCVRGMSAGILRSDLLHPEKMQAYCQSIANSCLQGSVNYHVLMFGDANKTIAEMCNQFTVSALQNSCTNLANTSPFRR